MTKLTLSTNCILCRFINHMGFHDFTTIILPIISLLSCYQLEAFFLTKAAYSTVFVKSYSNCKPHTKLVSRWQFSEL